MSEAPTAYPLAWPHYKPRTPPSQRKNGTFKSLGERISAVVAVERVEEQVRKLGGRDVLVSSNIRVGLGRNFSQAPPQDPGVAVYFGMKGQPYTLACDTYVSVPQNLAAIAAHLASSRAIERYGVASAAEVLQAFAALPPPADVKPKRPWFVVFGVDRSAVERDDIEALYKVRARKLHPDHGGDPEAFKELTAAKAEALAEIGR